MEGIIITSTGNWYEVADSQNRICLCKVKGNFRLKGVRTTNPVAVGDHVEFQTDPRQPSGKDGKEHGWITAVRERRNCIIRKSVNLSKQTHILAANIDMAFLVIGLTHPRTPQGFIDRFLVTGEAYHVPVCLVFNKSDLFGKEEWNQLRQMEGIYAPLGYDVLHTNVADGQGTDRLKEKMKDRVCLFSGNSGVGKSALIRHMQPDLDIRIGEISTAHLKGKHTTTHARMYRLDFGAYIVDTPGIKEFGMVQMKKDELSLYFPEMKALIPECRFNNCTHEHEPDCAVKKAVEDGRISLLRYRSYLNILHGDEVPLPGLLENKQEKK